MIKTETIINGELIEVYNPDKIIVISGKLKYYLADLIDRDNMTVDQFTESIFDMREIQIENKTQNFINLNRARTQKTIGANVQNFEYAGYMRNCEWEILSEIVENNIAEVFFITLKNVGYYLVYVN